MPPLIGAVIGAVAGGAAAGVGTAAVASWAGTAIAVGAGVGMVAGQSYNQNQQTAAAKSAAKKANAAALSSQTDLAGESAELTTNQMQLQVGQRKIASLEEALTNRTTSPRILTLPSNQPAQTQVDKINAWIDSVVRG